MKERGATLIEVLLASAILGTSVVSLLMALTLVYSSERTQAEVARDVTGAVDVVDALADGRRVPFVTCAGPGIYQSLLDEVVAPDLRATVVAVAHWDGEAFVDACSTPALGLQRISLTIGAGRELDLVKRDGR